MSTATPSPKIHVAYRPQILSSEDFPVYVRPSAGAFEGAERPARLTCSWRSGSEYLTFGDIVGAYAHEIPPGEWTALFLPRPPVSGLISFELGVSGAAAGQGPSASADVVSTSYDQLGLGHETWVFGWSPAREIAEGGTPTPAPLPGLDLRMRTLTSLADGTDLRLLSIGVDTVAPPEFLAFERFPYDHGGGRVPCDVPHGPQPRTAFLLPVSPSRRTGALQARIGSMGGYLETTIDLNRLSSG